MTPILVEMTEWLSMLRDARAKLGLDQAELAARAHISLPSLKAHETGRRHPSRPYLTAILDALKIDRSVRNQILASAGYATDSFELGSWPDSRFMFTPGEAAAFIDGHPWPAFILDEMMELTAANNMAQRLWRVDLATEFLAPLDRNMLALASTPRFADRCTNLPEILTVMASAFKGHFRGPETLDNPSPYFSSVLQRFFAGDPRFIQTFFTAWQNAEPATVKIRWQYPVIWTDPEVGTMQFRALVGPANEPDGLAFNDWIPINEATWAALTKLESVPSARL